MRPPRTARHWPGAVLLAALTALPVAAADKTEEYASGKPKGKYKVNDDGQKDGAFTEFYENGKVRAKGTYKADKFHGAHTAYYPTGGVLAVANYEAGVLTGNYAESTPTGGRRLTAVYKDGAPTSFQLSSGGKVVAEQDLRAGDWMPLRRPAEIQLDLSAIATSPAAAKPGDAPAIAREAGLRRLMAYRASCGVPFDLIADKDMAAHAAAGAELCQALGRGEHTPKNTVGWAADKFDFAYEGTSKSNLYWHSNGCTLTAAVDFWMDDSDADNISRVAHRLWCLNPAMQKTGFGLSSKGTFAAMWSFDKSRNPVPDYEYVADPPAGFAPIWMFGRRYAWSFTPNPEKYQLPDPKAVAVKLYQKTDKSPDKRGTEVKLDYTTASDFIRPTAIFRPQVLNLTEGSRYVVEVTGFQTKDGKAVTFTYLVVFVNTY